VSEAEKYSEMSFDKLLKGVLMGLFLAVLCVQTNV
jgi:hypothetical protein